MSSQPQANRISKEVFEESEAFLVENSEEISSSPEVDLPPEEINRRRQEAQFWNNWKLGEPIPSEYKH